MLRQQDGAVTGGTPPYSITWSNSADTEDITDLAAGLYIITVVDADELEVTPSPGRAHAIKVKAESYPNRYNVSCHECYNGSIDVTVYNGVEPYSYEWNDGVTTQDRANLGSSKYAVTVTDGSGCVARSETVIHDPASEQDWTAHLPGRIIGTADEQESYSEQWNGAVAVEE